MAEYIEREAAMERVEDLVDTMSVCTSIDECLGMKSMKSRSLSALHDIPAADVVDVRQIRAFIDKLITERDKYDLHSMRWEYYDCDRLLIEQMLDEIDGERKGGDE